jgi:hypothetical protein
MNPFSKSLLVVGLPAKQYLDRPYPINPNTSIVALPEGHKVHWVDLG